MKFFIILLIAVSSFPAIGSGAAKPNACPVFSYDLLMKDAATDYVEPMQALFEICPSPRLLQFGVSKGTYFLLSQCESVTSIELLGMNERGEYFPEEFKKYKQALLWYKDFNNWEPKLYYCQQDMADANLVAVNRHPFKSQVDAGYLEEIKDCVNQAFNNKSYDVALIDSTIYLRAVFVNALFGQVDIVVAHGTGDHSGVFGWQVVAPPAEYEVVNFSRGSGTTFWIHNKHRDIIDYLRRSFQ